MDEDFFINTSIYKVFYKKSSSTITLREQDDHVVLFVDCMDKACKDILSTHVRIPVEISAYNSDSGYHNPRADQIEGMLQGILYNQQVTRLS